MIEGLNKLLETNDIMCRIGSTWYKLDELGPISHNSFPIFVSDDSGESIEFDMADIDEFDPMFETFRNMDNHIIGEA